ncbi:FecR family protein [Parabacteroides timonensis]|uniref:FecR family protein n=1 Tax=Parabacteroides timonensis TaxID=1871013 RepID=UPI00094E388E|nr:FecR domain-containing protein [Parabacteroides timonensis]
MENKTDHIIAKVLNDEASSEDILYLSQWLNEDEKNQKEFCELRSYWNADVNIRNEISPILSVDKLQQKINNQTKHPQKRQTLKYMLPIAAAITLFVALAINLWLIKERKQPCEYYTYLTSESTANLTMDDGTKITLNKNSRLTYSSEYGIENRSVKLIGEAFFDVEKDSIKPFKIEIGNASVTVLGTTFNIKAEESSNKITATLIKGSIQFHAAEQNLILKPGQQLTFLQNSNHISVEQVDTDIFTSWTTGLLKYKSIPFVKLISELKTKYQVEINISNKRLTNPDIVVSGTFSENQNIGEILTVISKSLPFRWEKKDDKYIIK